MFESTARANFGRTRRRCASVVRSRPQVLQGLSDMTADLRRYGTRGRMREARPPPFLAARIRPRSVRRTHARPRRAAARPARAAQVLERILVDLLPEDIHVRTNGRVFVAVTRVWPTLKGELLSQFESKARAKKNPPARGLF